MLALLLVGCDTSDLASGASEPVRVREGTFHEGALPVDATATTPTVVYAAGVNYVATQGQGNIGFTGLASADAYSVAVAMVGVGSGYWVVPVDGPDVTQDDNLLFDLTVDFPHEVPYGLQTLQFVAIDADGAPGPAYEATVCVLPDFADNNFAACSPEVPPQDTVISLRWDTDVDLDLVVVTPAGKVVDSRSPTTEADGSEEESVGELTRDSNSDCHIDSVRLESLVFTDAPPDGTYDIYANLDAPCHQSYVNFALSLYRRVDKGDGTWAIEETDLAWGQLLGTQANQGTALGTFVTSLTLP